MPPSIRCFPFSSYIFSNSSPIIAEDSNFCNVCNKSFNLLLERILYNEIIQYDTSLTEQKRTEVTHYGNDFKMVRFQIRHRYLRADQTDSGRDRVITTLYDTAPGEVWSRERIAALKAEVAAAGLHIAGIESVNVHDAIKTGAPDRDLYIDHYIETLENLGKEDIHLVCYNFMPVFDWTRTELARKRPDGSTVLAYTQEAVDALDPEKMFESIAGDTNGSIMPGWEPERMAHIKELFAMYKDIDDEKLFANPKYFLERIMPVCDKYDINMAIHPDDPAWSVFGLPRIIINKKNILRMMSMVDNPHNGVIFLLRFLRNQSGE